MLFKHTLNIPIMMQCMHDMNRYKIKKSFIYSFIYIFFNN